jgi:hypothetical protein
VPQPPDAGPAPEGRCFRIHHQRTSLAAFRNPCVQRSAPPPAPRPEPLLHFGVKPQNPSLIRSVPPNSAVPRKIVPS